MHKEMLPMYVEHYLSRQAVHNWVQKFSEGRTSIEDELWACRPVEIATPETLQRVQDIIRAERRVTVGAFFPLVWPFKTSFGRTLSWWWCGWKSSSRVVPTATKRILRRRFPGTFEMVEQVFKFVWRLCWKINVVCMSLSPFYSFQSRFVTYLLNRPRTLVLYSTKQCSQTGPHHIWCIYTPCLFFDCGKHTDSSAFGLMISLATLLWWLLSHKTFFAPTLGLTTNLGVGWSWLFPASSI